MAVLAVGMTIKGRTDSQPDRQTETAGSLVAEAPWHDAGGGGGQGLALCPKMLRPSWSRVLPVTQPVSPHAATSPQAAGGGPLGQRPPR